MVSLSNHEGGPQDAAPAGSPEAELAHLDARLDPRSPAPLAVAVSGGGDSVALLHLASVWAGRRARPLIVLTVDHGLNPDSARWAGFVSDRAARRGHACRVLPWTGPKPAAGLPAAARAARHALLADAARDAGARVILLGHTADDVAEADWMRAQGSTLGRLRPWSPSPAWPEGRGLMLLRPLLTTSRAHLRAWLAARGAAWLEDPANADPCFARARARAALNALERRGDAPGDASAGPLSRDPALLRDIDRTLGVLSLSRQDLQGPAAHSLLSAALLCASGAARPPRGSGVAALLVQLSGEAPVTATLAGARLQTDGDVLRLGREPGRRPLPTLAVSAGETRVWDGRFEITASAGAIRPAAGVLSRLSATDRTRLALVPDWARPTLPVREMDGAFSLAPARPLMAARLRAAAGLVQSERDLPEPTGN